MTKHVVSVSLGSSTRDKAVTIELGGVEIRAERRGVDGDTKAFNRLMKELDGTVDVLAVGGTEIAFHVDGEVIPLGKIGGVTHTSQEIRTEIERALP